MINMMSSDRVVIRFQICIFDILNTAVGVLVVMDFML